MNVKKNVELWWQFTRRDIESRHKGSYLGVIWMALTPLLEFVIYALVFGVIFGGRYGVVSAETHASYALGVLLSLTLLRFVSEIIGAAPVIIIGQPNLVKKVVFPVELLPLCMLAGISFRIGVSLVLFFIGYIFFGPGFSFINLWLPIIIIPLLLLAAGLAWGLAALGVFLRDISQLTSAASMVLLYSSAVFYSTSMIFTKSPLAWSILRFNPVLHLLENARRVMLWQLPPQPGPLLYAWAVSLLAAVIGYVVFRKLRPAFADVL